MVNLSCPNPKTILEISNENGIVKDAVEAWETGVVPWEQAMMSAVIALAAVNSALLEKLHPPDPSQN